MKRERTVVKGCERRIRMVKDLKSELFAEAYFILKRENREATESEMVSEAERLLKELSYKKRPFAKGFTLDDRLVFLSGVLLAVVILALGALFF